MEEERKHLFIQQKINLLSGDYLGEGKGDFIGLGMKQKPHRRKSQYLENTKVEALEDVKYNACARLAQIVDFNTRNENAQHAAQTCSAVTTEPRSHKTENSVQSYEQTVNAENPAHGLAKESGIRRYTHGDTRLSNHGTQHSTWKLEALQSRNSEHPPVLEETQGGGIVLLKIARSGSHKDKCVSEELVNRIRTENILRLAKETNREKIHEPKKCKSCQEKEAAITEFEFLKHKKTKLESEILNRQVDDVINTTDTVLVIGEIARTLPKPSDDRDLVWRKLLKKQPR